MGFLPEPDLGSSFIPFSVFQKELGFIPKIFRAQTLLPRVIEAEAAIANAVLHTGCALSRLQREYILLAVAAAHRNIYCITAHWEVLRNLSMTEENIRALAADHEHANLADGDVALLNFSLKLSQQPTRITRADIGTLRQHGVTDLGVLEAVLVTAFAEFLCTLSVGLGVNPDFEPRNVLDEARIRPKQEVSANGIHAHQGADAILGGPDPGPDFPPFIFFKEKFGFIPNIFRAQNLRPDVIEAEAKAVDVILLTEDVLSRIRKEYILLVVSAANLNTYCVAVHCELLRALGVPQEDSDQVALNHHQAGLAGADSALLDFALKLNKYPREVSSGDIAQLEKHGFSATQVLESIVMVALSRFLNTVQMGLGTTPDFKPKIFWRGEASPLTVRGSEAPIRDGSDTELNLSPGSVNLTTRKVREYPHGSAVDSRDAGLVRRAQGGDLAAFEELVSHYSSVLYRTLIGITGNAEDAEDGVQNAFLKAFEHIVEFKGEAKFSTWLTRITINEGLQILRRRRPLESLEWKEGEQESDFQPLEIRSWNDPEQLYTKKEIRELVEGELMKLPAKYRAAVILRDIEQLSTEEAAVSLGLGVAALKSRLLRGRLLLREALAPHFIARPAGSKDV